MPHIILDVNFPHHPKVLRCSPLAQLLHIRGILYACQHLTDGDLPQRALGLLAYDLTNGPELVKELIEAKLWHDDGAKYTINSYLDFQYSKREVEELRRKKQEAGRAGGQAKARQQDGADVAERQQPASRVLAECQVDAKQNAGSLLGDRQEKGKEIPKSSSTPISDVLYPISDVRSPMSDTRSPITDSKKKKEKSCKQALPVAPAKSAATWSAYSTAYEKRYRVVPVSNAGVNAMLCRVVDKLGADEAPKVAAFFVTHNEAFYVKRRHPVELLLKDAEGLRTQWASGVKATTSEAREAERADNLRETSRRVDELLGGKGARA